MNGFLQTIIAHKRKEIEKRKFSVSRDQLSNHPFFHSPRRSLSQALTGKAMAVVAEIKKASPSAGIIRADFDHRTIAGQYVAGGASALSVLTDERFFQGHQRYLEEVRSITQLPILRKDFIIDSYQLYESKAMGADAVLLIAAALDSVQLGELHTESNELGLECLVEVHSKDEIEALQDQSFEIIGINNRNLSTFETTLETTIRLRPLISPAAIVVSESSIRTQDDLRRLVAHDIHAALIGESLMRASDPGEALRTLLSTFVGERI